MLYIVKCITLPQFFFFASCSCRCFSAFRFLYWAISAICSPWACCLLGRIGKRKHIPHRGLFYPIHYNRGQQRHLKRTEESTKTRAGESYPDLTSGGTGSGLVKPALPTSQYVSSTPLPWRKKRILETVLNKVWVLCKQNKVKTETLPWLRSCLSAPVCSPGSAPAGLWLCSGERGSIL